MSPPSPMLDAAVQAAFAAGREIMDVHGTGPAVEFKQDRSPLTDADRRAHAAILRKLERTRLPVLSEEGRSIPAIERQAWQRYWLVDPLDGTKEFIARNGEFTVNLALMERDAALHDRSRGTHVPIGGVLFAPAIDVLYLSWKGGGAHRVDGAASHAGLGAAELTRIGRRLPLHVARKGFTVVASRSHKSPDTTAFIERMEAEHGKVETTSMGSALKICLVAEGAADVYPRFAPTMEWDTAAGHAICLEAGREIIDQVTGADMRYNKDALVNHSFVVQEKIIEHHNA